MKLKYLFLSVFAAFTAAALSTARHVKFGNHGGLSADELEVPLFVVRP